MYEGFGFLLIWGLLVVGSGLYILVKRQQSLNRTAFLIYCLGSCWGLITILEAVLTTITYDAFVWALFIGTGIGGLVTWRWWIVVFGAARPAHTTIAPPANPPGETKTFWTERKVAVVWALVAIFFWMPMAILFDEERIYLLRDITDTYCYGDYKPRVCRADTESGAAFGAFVALASGTFLYFRRKSRLGKLDKVIYSAGGVISIIVLLVSLENAGVL